MDKVDEYIDNVYKDLYENEEVKQMKNEMKEHLLNTINELESKGLSEEESIKIALDMFGDSNRIKKELKEIFCSQIKSNKVILRTALISLIIGIMLCSITFIINYFELDFRKGPLLKAMYTIGPILEQNNTMSLKAEKQIKKILNKYDKNNKGSLKYYAIFKRRNSNDNFLPSVKQAALIYNSKYHFKDASNIQYYTGDIRGKWIESIRWSHNYDLKEKLLGYNTQIFGVNVAEVLLILAICCITIYWILFSVWSITTEYYQKGTNLFWFFSFIAFNIIGYGAFWIYNRKNKILIINK